MRPLSKKLQEKIEDLFDYVDIKEEAGEFWDDIVGEPFFIQNVYTAEYKNLQTYVKTLKDYATRIYKYWGDKSEYYDIHVNLFFNIENGVTRIAIIFAGFDFKNDIDEEKLMENNFEELMPKLTKWYDIAKLLEMYYDIHNDEIDEELAKLMEFMFKGDQESTDKILEARRIHKLKFVGLEEEI